MKSIFLLTLSLLFTAKISHAAPAHKHGFAQLSLVQQGNKIELRLQTPAINLTGEEAKHLTPTQQAKMQQAIAQLKDFPKGIILEGVNCHLDDVHSHTPTAEQHREEEQHAHSQQEAHQDIELEYHLSCNSNKQPDAISIRWFSYFPLLQQLEVIWLLEQPGSQVLTPKTSRIEF